MIYTPGTEPGNWEDITINTLAAQERVEQLKELVEVFSGFHEDIDKISEKLRNKTARILEFGSGNGEFLHSLALDGFRGLVGIDFRPRSENLLSFLEEGSVRVVEHDLSVILDDTSLIGQFDLVYGNLIFDKRYYNTEKRGQIIRNAHTYLRSGGLFYNSGMHDITEIEDEVRNISPRNHTLINASYISP